MAFLLAGGSAAALAEDDMGFMMAGEVLEQPGPSPRLISRHDAPAPLKSAIETLTQGGGLG